jgi:hypothetical protein
MTDRPDAIGVALRVTRALDSLRVLHTIGGSIASSVAGEPRATLDIDVVAALEPEHVAPLVAALATEFYIDSQALLRAVVERRSANVIHHATQIKVDIFVAGGTPLDALQLQRRRAVDLDGRVIYVHPPEDVLLQKLRWFRMTGETSDRQWRDVLGIIRVQGASLDRAYLREHAPVVHVSDLLVRAFDEAAGR